MLYWKNKDSTQVSSLSVGVCDILVKAKLDNKIEEEYLDTEVN